MNIRAVAQTEENKALSHELEHLNAQYLELYTRHKQMVEDEEPILTSLYLHKLGNLQLELLQKQTEANRLKMTLGMIQSAINRDESPNLEAIDKEINHRLNEYYSEINSRSAQLDKAREVLSSLLPEEQTANLREIFRVLCKKLHPDLNPNQSEKDTDLFIRVKAAYDLQRLDELQKILLYLENTRNEEILPISNDQKKERIKYLKKAIEELNLKIDSLMNDFPFTIKELITDTQYIAQKQVELRTQIKTAETEIEKNDQYIKIICNE